MDVHIPVNYTTCKSVVVATSFARFHMLGLLADELIWDKVEPSLVEPGGHNATHMMATRVVLPSAA